jgi:hypothetical protein
MTDLLDCIAYEMDRRPEDFVEDDHCVRDKKTGIEYWIANGFFSYGIYRPVKMYFGFRNQFRFRKILNKWRADVITRKNLETYKAIEVAMGKLR